VNELCVWLSAGQWRGRGASGMPTHIHRTGASLYLFSRPLSRID